MKKEKRNKLIFGFFIIILMISSTLGFIYSGGDSVKINGYKFMNTDQGWKVWIDEIDSYLYFNYLPDELGYNLDLFDLELGYVKIYNENWDLGGIQRLQAVLLFEGIQTQILNTTYVCTEDILILNNSDSIPVLTKEEKCLYLDGNYIMLTEGVIYKVFGIV
jgi:hypothetical protein